MIKFFIAPIVASVFLYSATDIKVKSLDEKQLKQFLNIDGAINKQNVEDKKIDDEQKNSKETTSHELNNDTYEDIAIYNYIVAYDTKSNKKKYLEKFENTKFVTDNVLAYNKKLEEQKKALEEEKKNEEEKQSEERTIAFSGYCSSSYDIEVEKIQAYNVLNCLFDENELNISSSKMMVMLSPLTDRNALVGKPIYLQYGQKKISIENGIMLTADRTSMNVANFVNDKKLKKLSGEFMTQGGDAILNNSIAYMKQKEASQVTEEVVSESSVSGTTTTTASNTEEPKVETYLASTGLQLLSGLIKIGGILLSEDSHPLFKVHANQQFYVDFVVTLDEKNKKTINYMIDTYEKSNKEISVGSHANQETLQLPTISISE